ncbi:hypothetical protein Tco_1319147 [Tanacetum coccineum]
MYGPGQLDALIFNVATIPPIVCRVTAFIVDHFLQVWISPPGSIHGVTESLHIFSTIQSITSTGNGYPRKGQKSKPKRQNRARERKERKEKSKSKPKAKNDARDDVFGLRHVGDPRQSLGNDCVDTSKGCDGFKEAQDDLKGQD